MPKDAATGIEDDNLGKLVEQALDAYRRAAQGQPPRSRLIIGNNKLAEIELHDSPLADQPALRRLYWTHPPTTEQKNWAMRSLIEWAAAGLRPSGEPAPHVPAWLTYLVLQQFYLQGRTWPAIIDDLNIQNTGHYQDRVLAAMTERIRDALENEHELDSLRRAVVARRLAALSADEHRLLEFAAILGQPFRLAELEEAAAELKLGPAGRLVDSLLERRLLVTGDRDETYLAHPDTAGGIARHIDDPHLRRAYHRLSARLLERRGDYLNAARCLRTADFMREAAALLIEQYADLVGRRQTKATLALFDEFQRGELGDKLYAELKIAAGAAALLARDARRAESELEAALAVAGAFPLLRVLAYYYLGKTGQTAKNPQSAVTCFEKALARLDALPANESTTRHDGTTLTAGQLRFDVLLGLAWVLIQEAPDLARAAALLAEAERALPPDDSRRECELHNGWAGLYKERRDRPAEEARRRQAYLAAQETGDIQKKIMTAHNLGQTLVHMGRRDDGLDYLHISLELARQADNRRDIGKNLQAIGAAHYFKGDFATAIDYYLQALEYYKESGHENWQGQVYHDLAEAYGELGQPASLRYYYDLARAQAADLPQLSHNLDELFQRFELSLREKMDDDETRILEKVMADGRVTNKIVQALLGVTRNVAGNKLEAMVKKGLLRPMGGERKGRYYVPGGSEE